MSFKGDSSEHESEVDSQNVEIITLLKAVVIGLEILTNQEPGTLKQLVEDE